MSILPLVSVSCITYNHKKYIRDAIESFLMQRTDFPIEIIIHDDASTDGTTEIVKEYEGKYPNLIYPIFQKENQYSKGIKPLFEYVFPKTRGKYIALCEGDDYWIDSYKLQKQIKLLEENSEYSMCFHNAYIVWEGKKKKRKFCDCDKSLYNTIDLIEKNWFIPTQSIVYRKNDFEYKEWMNFVFGGDYVLQLFLSTKGDIYYIDEVMSVYRMHRKGLSESKMPLYHNVKMVDRLSYFNYYTNFKYNTYIQKRFERLMMCPGNRMLSKCILRNIIKKIFGSMCFFCC